MNIALGRVEAIDQKRKGKWGPSQYDDQAMAQNYQTMSSAEMRGNSQELRT